MSLAKFAALRKAGVEMQKLATVESSFEINAYDETDEQYENRVLMDFGFDPTIDTEDGEF